jgi:hypothetical protein
MLMLGREELPVGFGLEHKVGKEIRILTLRAAASCKQKQIAAFS